MNDQAKKTKWRWPTRIRLLLAGWRRKRSVLHRLRLPKSLSLFPEAERVLASFGGLKFGGWGSGFRVRLDPSLAGQCVEQVKLFQTTVDMTLYPVGEVALPDEFVLLVSDKGIVFSLFEIRGTATETVWELEAMGACFENVLRYLLDNREVQGDLNADLSGIGMLGKVWLLEEIHGPDGLQRRVSMGDDPTWSIPEQS